MVGEACLPSNAYYPRTPDYTLYSGVHVCWSEHSDSSFVYGFMSLDYGLGTMIATTSSAAYVCLQQESMSVYALSRLLEAVANLSQKGLSLETKNTQNHENRRLGLIVSLHMQHCSLRDCIHPIALALAVFDFQNNQDGLTDSNGNRI